MFERWVLEDLDWNGHRLEQGTKVGLLFGAANRDERRFPDPDRLDLGRADNQHLAFGAGIHRCVGEPLALVELEVAIGAVAKRVRELHLVTEELPRLESLVFRGVRELPLALA
jgi:cytochrome P450